MNVAKGGELVRFVLTLRALDVIELPPYKGSTFRGGFGTAFKKVVCTIKGTECDNCLLKSKCIYSYIFETPPPEDSEILRKYENAPHPFIIEPPPETKRIYKPGETITFNLVLIGKAIDYLAYFIYTFIELGKTGIGKGRGQYELTEVSCDGKAVYNPADGQLKYFPVDLPSISESLKSTNGFESSGSITFNFLTPTRLVVNEDLVVEPEFHHLIRGLLRRISNLSYFHYGERLTLDFKGLIGRASGIRTAEKTIQWYDWERYSSRQDTRMKLGGFIGKARFAGDMKEFVPFLKLGEILHVGKGTGFGLGKYGVEDGV